MKSAKTTETPVVGSVAGPMLMGLGLGVVAVCFASMDLWFFAGVAGAIASVILGELVFGS